MSSERRKKKRKSRDRSWADDPDKAFSRELKRHLRTDTILSDTAPTPDIPEDWSPNAVVVSHTKKYAFVRMLHDGPEEIRTRIAVHLVEGGSSLLAPGDFVLVEQFEDQAFVIAIQPRRTKLSRLAPEHARVREQVVAANVDILVVVAAAAKPAFREGLIDRYLIVADVGGVTPILCINKMDLVAEEPGPVQVYRDLGIRVIATSCETGQGIQELRQAIDGKVSVFAGHSGVGKSTLLNALRPDLDLETREVSEATQKGKHTTSSARLYDLDPATHVIDTPGIRQLGIWDVSKDEVAYYFPELAEAAPDCKFRDCTHIHEPDCAVRAAVDSGDILQRRYDSYRRLRTSLEEQDPKY